MGHVKHDFSAATIENIQAVTDMSKIANIVINHIEPDHASSLDRIMELCPGVPIYITDKGKKGLSRYFDTSRWDLRVVKTGDKLNIGKKTLTFIETPMLHWPDSMMTYVEQDKLLISQDAFASTWPQPRVSTTSSSTASPCRSSRTRWWTTTPTS
jgi:flavorubredoxin